MLYKTLTNSSHSDLSALSWMVIKKKKNSINYPSSFLLCIYFPTYSRFRALYQTPLGIFSKMFCKNPRSTSTEMLSFLTNTVYFAEKMEEYSLIAPKIRVNRIYISRTLTRYYQCNRIYSKILFRDWFSTRLFFT